MGRPRLTEQERFERKSRASLRCWADPEYRAKMLPHYERQRAERTGVPRDEETKRKISEACAAAWRRGRKTRMRDAVSRARKIVFEDERELTGLDLRSVKRRPSGQVVWSLTPVEVDGLVYRNVVAAAESLGLTVPTLKYRIQSRSERFAGHRLAQGPDKPAPSE